MKYEFKFNKEKIDFEKKCYDEYECDYGNTKKIEIKISKCWIYTMFEGTKDEFEEKYLISILDNVVIRSLIIYILKYNVDLEIKDVSLTYDNKTIPIYENSEKELKYAYSLLQSSISFNCEQLKLLAIDKMLSYRKSNKENFFVALFSFMAAKGKKYEIEKFIYYWMTFNSIYNETGIRSKGDKKKNHETDKMESLLKKMGYKGDVLTQEMRNKIFSEVVNRIYKEATDALDIYDCRIKSIFQEEYKKQIKEYDDDNYIGQVLTGLCYYLRCNYIHANQRVPFLIKHDDKEYKIIAIVNKFLDEYLEKIMIKLWNKIEKPFADE